MTDRTNCGACGDPVEFGSIHECWVWAKRQTQEDLNEICPLCYELIYAPHWRCMPPEPPGV